MPAWASGHTLHQIQGILTGADSHMSEPVVQFLLPADIALGYGSGHTCLGAKHTLPIVLLLPRDDAVTYWHWWHASPADMPCCWPCE
jgi:hypothetical protein